MHYKKGDTIKTCYTKNHYSRSCHNVPIKIGVITGEGEEYGKICKQYQSFSVLYLYAEGIGKINLNSNIIMGYALSKTIYYPVLIGDKKGWMSEEDIERYDV